MLLVTLLLNVMLLNDPSIISNTSAVKGSYICHYLFMQVNIIQHVYNISKLFLYEKIKKQKNKKEKKSKKAKKRHHGSSESDEDSPRHKVGPSLSWHEVERHTSQILGRMLLHLNQKQFCSISSAIVLF